MNKPPILFHRPGSWHSDIASSTKILCRMFNEQGYPSYYFGLHPDSLSLLRHPLRQMRQWQDEVAKTNDPTLLRTASIFPMRDTFPCNTSSAIELGYRSSLPSLRTQTAKLPTPEIIWAARPGASALKKLYPQARLVMQVVDYYPAFRGPGIRDIEKQDYARADHIFLIGEALKPYLMHELNVPQEKISVLGQGVHYSRYNTSPARPVDFPDTSGPVAVWVGVLSKADDELLRAAAAQLQSMGGSLLLIGPLSRASQSLAHDYPCVQLQGPRSPDEVPAYLVHADIGLMLYDCDKADVYRGQNPLKLYEYAAAGLTILSTPHAEYEYLQAPVHICTSTQEVVVAIRQFQQSDQTRLLCRQFAQEHDWNSVFDRARSIIDQLATSATARYDTQPEISG